MSLPGNTNRRSLLILSILLIALLPSLFLMARPFLTALMLAAVLAIVLNPFNKALCVRMGRRGSATLVTTLGAVILFGSIFSIAGIAFVTEVRANYKSLSEKSADQGGVVELVSQTTDRLIYAVAHRFALDPEEIRGQLMTGLKSAGSYILQHMGGALGGISSVVFNSILATIFLFLLLRHGEEWRAKAIEYIPLDERVSTNLFECVRSSVVGTVHGVLAVALSQGLLLGLGFWFIGVRSPVLWGVIGGLASLIPVIGSPIVWIPVVIAYLVMAAWWKAIFVAVWGGLIVGSIDNILRPWVVGASVQMNPVLMALAALGGTYAFGVAGILLGPLIISLAVALVEELQTAREGSPLPPARAQEDPSGS